jgi:hypothetical protein
VVPLISIVPAIVTSPVAKIVTGVLALFFRNFTVMPAGMLTVVKLKTPFGGSCRVVLTGGLNAPSAPVLPLVKAWAWAGANNPRTIKPVIKKIRLFI